MNIESEKWIVVLKEVSLNPFRKILCPVCGKHFISITIIPWTNEDQKVDVYLTCDQCKSRNVFSKNVIINP